MLNAVRDAAQRVWSRRDERRFAIGLFAITALGAILRVQEFSRSTLYRDDAWVALSSRVPLHTAWHMVGTAPGYTLFIRWWVGVVHNTTWLLQAPSFIVAVVGITALGIALRWSGASNGVALMASCILALSHLDVIYSTHIKPYAHDALMSVLLVVAARWFQRGGSAWWFTSVSLLSLATSLTTLPIVVGLGVALTVHALRHKRLRGLVPPGIGILVPLGLLLLSIRGGISPRLSQSWKGNFLDWSSLRAWFHSLWVITQGFIMGVGGISNRLYAPHYDKAIIYGSLVAIVVAIIRRHDVGLWVVGLVSGYVALLLHLAPLGTGRTDAYLHPALIVLVVTGADHVRRTLVARWRGGRLLVSALIVGVLLVSLVDRVKNTPSYPGGTIAPVVTQANLVLGQGGAVLIEGSSRWPWTYYEARHFRIAFSRNYNTGFYPIVTDPHVVVMPGSSIEGGYNPVGAIERLHDAPVVLYVRSDDWLSDPSTTWGIQGNPLEQSFLRAGYTRTLSEHVPGFVVEVLRR